MNFELTIAKTTEIEAELEVIFVIDADLKHRFVEDKKLLKKAGFTGGQDETCLLLENNRLYVAADSLASAHLRTAAASVAKALLGKSYASLKVSTYTNKGCTYSLRAMVEGFRLIKVKRMKVKLAILLSL